MGNFKVHFYSPEECKDQTVNIEAVDKESAFMEVVVKYDCGSRDIYSVTEIN